MSGLVVGPRESVLGDTRERGCHQLPRMIGRRGGGGFLRIRNTLEEALFYVVRGFGDIL